MLLRLEVRLLRDSLKLSLFSLQLVSSARLSSTMFFLVSVVKLSSRRSSTLNCFVKSSDICD